MEEVLVQNALGTINKQQNKLVRHSTLVQCSYACFCDMCGDSIPALTSHYLFVPVSFHTGMRICTDCSGLPINRVLRA